MSLHHEFGSASKTGPTPTEEGIILRWLGGDQTFPLMCEVKTPRTEIPLMVRQPFEAQRGLPRLSVVGRPVGTTVHGLQSLGEAGSVVRLKDPGL
jgi:hypothetical protein